MVYFQVIDLQEEKKMFRYAHTNIILAGKKVSLAQI